jgi:sugar lactone lactonase YvrE
VRIGQRGLKVNKLAAACAAAVLGTLMLAAAPAVASTLYVAGTPFGTFSLPAGVAVDNSTLATKGDVYVVDIGNGRVVKFDATGAEQNFSKLGSPDLPGPANLRYDAVSPVGPSAGDLFFSALGSEAAAGTVEQYNAEGEHVGTINLATVESATFQPTGVAIDPSDGDLYVVDNGNGVIDKLEEKEPGKWKLIKKFAAGELSGAVDSIAVGAGGDVYVTNQGIDLLKYSPEGIAEPAAPGSAPQSVAVDPSTNDVFVGENAESSSFAIGDYSSGGTLLLPPFGLGEFEPGGSFGIAVNAETHAVYASRIGGTTVNVYTAKEGSPPAVPTTEAATAVTGSSAVLNGTVMNPSKTKVSYYFEYKLGSSCTGGTKTTAEQTENETQAATASVASLAPGTEYAFCLVAENEFGATPGAPLTFTTGAAGPKIETEALLAVTSTTAKIEALINPSGSETTCEVQYGTVASGAYAEGTKTCPGPLSSGLVGQHVVVELTGLAPGTEYHFRYVANNNADGGIPTVGVGTPFTTKPALPAVVNKPASNITRTTASLSGEINSSNSPTTYYIEYGETENYGALGSPTKVASMPAHAGPLPIEPQQLEELRAGTEYHYRIVAQNETGTTKGPDSTFTTAPAQPPIVESESSEQVTQTTAKLISKVNADGLQTSFALEVGTEVEGKILYTPTFGEVGSGNESVELTFSLTSLLPGTTYHWRVVLTNQDGTFVGQDLTFTTTTFANPIVEPPHPLLIPVPPEAHVTKVESKLEKALKACAAKPKKKRAACDKQAEKKYGPKVKTKKTKKKKKKKK